MANSIEKQVYVESINLINEAIEFAVRWHYYDAQRGRDTADPSQSGMGSEALAKLIGVIGTNRRRELEDEGLAWAQAELNMAYGPPLWGTLPWNEYKKQCTGK